MQLFSDANYNKKHYNFLLVLLMKEKDSYLMNEFFDKRKALQIVPRQYRMKKGYSQYSID